MTTTRGKPQLTARGIKVMLSRAGVDYSALTITEDDAVWRDVETGQPHTYVMLAGPKDVRTRAFHALLSRGLTIAPYPEYDMWSR